MSRTATLRRRLRRVETKLEAQAERESWRGTPEQQREIAFDYFLSFLQSAYYFGGFYDLARYWAFKLHERAHGHLEPIVEKWAWCYKATPEQRERALADVRRGLDEPFEDRDDWSRYWWGGSFPPRGGGPSGKDIGDWLERKNPPRWEIAVALDISRTMPASRHAKTHPANRLQQDIKTVDKHFNGPRTRRKEARLEELRIRFEPASPKSSTSSPKSTTTMEETTPADRLSATHPAGCVNRSDDLVTCVFKT